MIDKYQFKKISVEHFQNPEEHSPTAPSFSRKVRHTYKETTFNPSQANLEGDNPSESTMSSRMPQQQHIVYSQKSYYTSYPPQQQPMGRFETLPYSTSTTTRSQRYSPQSAGYQNAHKPAFDYPPQSANNFKIKPFTYTPAQPLNHQPSQNSTSYIYSYSPQSTSSRSQKTPTFNYTNSNAPQSASNHAQKSPAFNYSPTQPSSISSVHNSTSSRPKTTTTSTIYNYPRPSTRNNFAQPLSSNHYNYVNSQPANSTYARPGSASSRPQSSRSKTQYEPAKSTFTSSSSSRAPQTQRLQSTVAPTPGTSEYQALQDDLLRSQALFTDPEFPPSDSSLFLQGMHSSSRFSGTIVWKRPKDIVSSPKFIYDGASRHDLEQGYLGNCWFVAGVAVLATSHPELMSRVVPHDQGYEPERYTGMFRFNFWWYGKWTEVIVDDYIPTDGFHPIYCSNRERPEEMWPCLIEKAYAKLHGCYQALEGGNMQNSLVDMTGGISETIDLQRKDEVSPELYSLMLTSFDMKTLMGGAIFLPSNAQSSSEVRRSNGLYMGHAYSITDFKQISSSQGTVDLLRLRNPWGKGEWNGAWSDNSREMMNLSPELQNELNFVNLDDGEFWISYDDFIFNFDQLQLCHLSPDAFLAELADNDQKQQWNVTVFHDAWIKGVTAGGCGNPPDQDLKWKNPQFYVTLDQPDSVHGHGESCTLLVALMQHVENKQPVAIGFDVYKLKDSSMKPLDGSRAPQSDLILTEMSGTYTYNREVTKRFELDQGTYAIMPSTFNPHEEAEFLLRLVTESRAESGVLDENVNPTPSHETEPTPKPTDPFEDLFYRHAASDRKLNAEELRLFLQDISLTELQDPLDFPLESCRSVVTLMDENKSGLLNIDETRRAWKEIKAYRDVFKQFDADNNNKMVTYELGSVFSKLGFPINRAVLTAIVRRYGDRDNNITLTDFILLVCKLTSLYASFHTQSRKRGTSNNEAIFNMNEFLEVTMFT